MPDQTGTVTVIGIAGYGLDNISPDVEDALRSAHLVIGGRRHLEAFEDWQQRRGGAHVQSVTIGSDADDACRRAAAAAGDGIPVCVLASGDPGFFGIVRALLRVVDRKHLVIVPAPSSVSLAFARIGLPWDDATVISAHGRPLADAIGAIRVSRKVAVLTSPGSPPEAVGKALVEARAAVDVVAVCSRLGHAEESVTMVGLDDLAGGAWDPLSVVILLGPAGRRIAGWGGAAHDAKPLAWGLPDDAYGHRDGMITKSEVRAVALGKLALPPAGVLWDVGAGSGSVAIECASLSPGLLVFAIEERREDVARISENTSKFGVAVTTVHGHVPEACEGLPDPDRVFVGGGGIGALDVALARLRRGGRIVATFAALDRAAEAASRLGNLVQVGVSRAKALPDGGVRLAAENPVFVAWGPDGGNTEP